MSAKDLFHHAVKNALLKDGWVITHDPLYVRFAGAGFKIDLGAEKVIAAEKGKQKIAIEIKSFLNPSFFTDFHHALGQFLNYRVNLEAQSTKRILYLAVPVDTYNTYFSVHFVQIVEQRYHLNIVVYDQDKEEVVKWKKY